MTGLTVVELAERTRSRHYEIAEALADFGQRGLVEVDAEGRWKLTERGRVYGQAATDLRPLGYDDPGDVKATKRAKG